MLYQMSYGHHGTLLKPGVPNPPSWPQSWSG